MASDAAQLNISGGGGGLGNNGSGNNITISNSPYISPNGGDGMDVSIVSESQYYGGGGRGYSELSSEINNNETFGSGGNGSDITCNCFATHCRYAI